MSKKIQQFLESMGIVQEMRTPDYKGLATFEARLKTFEECKKHLKQDIHTLCQSGLFYMGTFIIIYNILKKVYNIFNFMLY